MVLGVVGRIVPELDLVPDQLVPRAEAVRVTPALPFAVLEVRQATLGCQPHGAILAGLQRIHPVIGKPAISVGDRVKLPLGPIVEIAAEHTIHA